MLRLQHSLLLTDAGMDSDGQLRPKNDAMFLASPVKPKRQIERKGNVSRTASHA